MHFQTVLLLAVALALNSAVIAADNLDESAAIREIERLGGKIKRDDTLPGHPVTAVSFRMASPFEDADVPLLKPFTNLTTLDLRGTKICGTHIMGAGLKELRELKKLTTLDLSDTKITDAGLAELELNNLTTLHLSRTTIKDAGLKQLRKLKNLTHPRPRRYADYGQRLDGA